MPYPPIWDPEDPTTGARLYAFAQMRIALTRLSKYAMLIGLGLQIASWIGWIDQAAQLLPILPMVFGVLAALEAVGIGGWIIGYRTAISCMEDGRRPTAEDVGSPIVTWGRGM